MRIQSFHVKGLLGQFDYDIPLNINERITIIHGQNGVGKTTTLRLLKSVLDLRYSFLRSCIFDELSIKFAGGGTLAMRQNPIEKERDVVSIEVRYTKGKEKQECTLKPQSQREKRAPIPLGVIDDLLPQLERIEQRLWWDHSTGGSMDFEEILEHYGEMLPAAFVQPIKRPSWLSNLLGSISTRFIQTQRLQRRHLPSNEYSRRHRRRETSVSAVAEIATEMAERIERNLRESGSLAASLDRTFPHRIIKGSLPKAATEAKIRKDYEAQQEYRNRLMAAGLIDSEELVPLPETTLDDSARKVLSFYLADVTKKMRVYSELLERAELFKSIIDDKKFLNKSIEINRTRGIEFKAKNGLDVPIQSLSSGEQQEIVLAYELLFRSGKNQLVMIDEPELSLHVTWQQKFLDDITRISELANLDFVIATHSPSIVGHRANLMVPLKGE